MSQFWHQNRWAVEQHLADVKLYCFTCYLIGCAYEFIERELAKLTRGAWEISQVPLVALSRQDALLSPYWNQPTAHSAFKIYWWMNYSFPWLDHHPKAVVVHQDDVRVPHLRIVIFIELCQKMDRGKRLVDSSPECSVGHYFSPVLRPLFTFRFCRFVCRLPTLSFALKYEANTFFKIIHVLIMDFNESWASSLVEGLHLGSDRIKVSHYGMGLVLQPLHVSLESIKQSIRATVCADNQRSLLI